MEKKLPLAPIASRNPIENFVRLKESHPNQQKLLSRSFNLIFLIEMVDFYANTFEIPAGNDRNEQLFFRIENIGFQVGIRIGEKLSLERNRFEDELDTMKFICKEFWIFVFDKQVDNLRTNHKGVFVLSDSNFQLFSNCVFQGAKAINNDKITLLMAYCCGLIRGALFQMGIENVSCLAETANLPSVTFRLEIGSNVGK